MLSKIQQAKELALQNALSFLQLWMPDGQLKGHEFFARNPTRDDSRQGSFSVNISTGAWGDFATGDRGKDLVGLLAYIRQFKQGQAADEILGTSVTESAPKPKQEESMLIPVMPRDPKPSDFKKKPDAMWIYRHADGRAAFAIGRYNNANGKTFSPLTWRQFDNAQRFAAKAYDEARPIYNLDKPIKNNIALIVEGEKCADVGSKLLYTTTWSGGAQAIDKTYFEPLRKANLIFWPDNDEVGIKSMIKIYERLGKPASARVVIMPEGTKPKTDIADLSQEDAVKAIQGSILFSDYLKQDQEELDILDEPELEAQEITHKIQIDNPPEIEDAPWRSLGYDRGQYYFWSRATKQVVSLSPAQIIESNLLQFAPLQWWADQFPSGKKAYPIEWGAIRNLMMAQCHTMGIFNPNNLRDVGVWLDGQSIVVHRGLDLVIDGQVTQLHKHKSRFIYEAGITSQHTNAMPATKAQAHRLQQIVDEFYFTNPMQGKYLAGWIVCAIVGGALQWRPHLFLTGQSGSGKSYVVNQVIKKILGEQVIQVIGDTTPAGLRQSVGNKSLPIIADEVEAESQRAQIILDDLFSLLRCASTDSDARIVKGGKDGTAHSFTMRSCALLSGINVNLQKKADMSRFTIITLTAPEGISAEERQSNFVELNKAIIHELTPDYCAAIRARCIGMAKVIRANHESFRVVCGELLGARLGDQIGALLSGAYSLVSDSEISLESARKWVNSQDWTEHQELAGRSDSGDFIEFLLSRMIQMDGGRRRTIGELINILSTTYSQYDADAPSDDDKKAAKETLSRHGLCLANQSTIVDDGWLVIANRNSELAKLLSDSPWARGWQHQVSRMIEAKKLKSWRFSGVVTSASACNITTYYTVVKV